MNRPSFQVRVSGSPPVAIVSITLSAACVLGWCLGSIPWWLGLAAVCQVFKTLGAVKQVRRYKAWRADWQAMGAQEERPAARKRRWRAWAFAAVAALLVVGIPAGLRHAVPGGIPDNKAVERVMDALLWMWLASGLYLVVFLAWKLFRLFWRVRRRSAEQRQARAQAAPVAWLVTRPLSSPSRAEAERELPDYCARLMGL